jgi:regulatory protein
VPVKESILRFCAYQERSQQEVRTKLYELGCHKTQVEELLAELISEDVVNEERFAKAIARGKFRMLNWGKIKIIQQLKLNRVSDYCIKKALNEISSEEYEQTLNRLSQKKWKELRNEKNLRIRSGKLYRYLLQKGFESSLISEILKEVLKGEEG